MLEGKNMTTKARATIDDLYRVPDNAKAEIVDGEVVLMSPTGDSPARAGFNIAVSLKRAETQTPGRAYPGNVGYRVRLPNRESFSPNVSWYTGPRSAMKFLDGAPAFAVEVRSEGDYGALPKRK